MRLSLDENKIRFGLHYCICCWLLYLFKRGPFRFDLFQTKALLSVFNMISLVKYSVELFEDVYQHEINLQSKSRGKVIFLK